MWPRQSDGTLCPGEGRCESFSLFWTPSNMLNMTQCSNWVHWHQRHHGQPRLAYNAQKLCGRIPTGWRRLRHPSHVITAWRVFSFAAGEKCLLWLLIKTCETTWVPGNFFSALQEPGDNAKFTVWALGVKYFTLSVMAVFSLSCNRILSAT